MTKGKPDPVADIAGILREAGKSAGISIKGVYLDETLREFFLLESPVEIPSLSVKSIDHEKSRDILRLISPAADAFLAGHEYMEVRNPQSEEHSIHLSAVVQGIVIDFVHMLRLDFKFSSNAGTIVRGGTSGSYPAYSTERIYFKSRLVPVFRGGGHGEFDPVRLKDSVRVEDADSGRRLFTSVLFDDFSSREISIELSRKAGDIFTIPVTICPMIVYEYFTACLNLPHPSFDRITGSAQVFEPLFIYLYADLMGAGNEHAARWINSWGDYLEVSGDRAVMTERMRIEVADFFSRYSMAADEELLVKGWKRILAV